MKGGSQPRDEGYVDLRGYKDWYRVVGVEGEEAGKLPLLCLHGGPGVPSGYLEPMQAIAESGRRVVFYDQLGCGNSDQPHDTSLWTVGLFLQELEVVRESLGLERIHLLGQSWGGMLALEYLLTKPSGVHSLVLASSLASVPKWASEANRLRSELPPEVQATLDAHEEAGTTDDPAYEEAMLAYYVKHVCRLDPWPECVAQAFEEFGKNPEVYHTMWGASEFTPNGSLKDWDVTDRLGEIEVPTLITSGRYDEATPAISETLLRGIAGSRWEVFENSAHLAHAEEPERYVRSIGRFLDEVETKA